MRIIIEIENGRTTVTVDDETVVYGPPDMPEPPSPPRDGDIYIGN